MAEDIYDRLPYGEVQREMSVAAFERLQQLLRDSHAEPDADERAEETILDVTTSPEEIVTKLDVFVPTFSNIGPILVEHDRLPDYLLDTLSHLVELIEERRLGAVPAKKQIAMQFGFIKEQAANYWQISEAERRTGQPFDIATVYVPGIGTVRVHMEYSKESERWKLGYQFTEPRAYEYHGGNVYRIAEGNLFTDPIGTEGDVKNIANGMYLPSRLDTRLFE